MSQSNVIKNSDPGVENNSYRPGEEKQQIKTSQRDKGRGQEGPSSKKRDAQGSDQHQEGAGSIKGWKSPQVNSWQQERGKEQRPLTEQEKHESIAGAHIYETDEDGTETESEDMEKTTEDEPGDPEPAGKASEQAKNTYSKIIETLHDRRGMLADSTRSDLYRARGEVYRSAENHPLAEKDGEATLRGKTHSIVCRAGPGRRGGKDNRGSL